MLYCSNLMMWIVVLLLPVFLFLPNHRVDAVNNTEVLRAKAVNCIKTRASTFLTDAQLAAFLDLVATEFYEGKDATTIQNDILNSLSTMLTGTQLMTGLQVYQKLTNDLGGSANTTNAMNLITGVVTNNGTPFLNQVKKRLAYLKSKGKGKYACINQMYRMCLQFMTFKRIKTIFTRVKAALDAWTWSIAKRDLASLPTVVVMFNNILQRKNFSIRRNATKRWKQAKEGSNPNGAGGIQAKLKQQKSAGPEEPLSVVIKATSMNLDQQKQAVEIANMALDTCNLESDIASSIKRQMDEITGQTWHVVVGRNFGTHVSWQQYVHFEAGKITLLLFQWQ